MKGQTARVCTMVLTALCAVIAAPGCGYTYQSPLDEKYATVFVSAFENDSREYGLQAPLTNALIRKFMADGRLRVVHEPRADLVIEGVLQDYSLRGLTYDYRDEATQFACYITASVRCRDGHTGEILWEEPRMVGATTFYTFAAGQSSDRLRGNADFFLPAVRSFPTEEENRGAAEALEQLASGVLYRTVEPW